MRQSVRWALVVLVLWGCGGTIADDTGTPTYPQGIQYRISGCVARKALPDPSCTPGAIQPGVTTQIVCTPGYSQTARDVPRSLKEAIYQSYGIQSHTPGQYEIDHLISLSLGGSNDRANLWPEAAPGYHEKDRAEAFLHDQLCRGMISLAAAQRQMAVNWQLVAAQAPRTVPTPESTAEVP